MYTARGRIEVQGKDDDKTSQDGLRRVTSGHISHNRPEHQVQVTGIEGTAIPAVVPAYALETQPTYQLQAFVPVYHLQIRPALRRGWCGLKLCP
mmetsp:Transcript_16791/g.26034  ORF Transcript_16791/g.26034 Transcript_16791/m.26034 type:complete len:94 (+) Transcript_16791:226-507(+)